MATSFLLSSSLIFARQEDAGLDDLNKSIEDKRVEIKKLKERIGIYEKNIQLSQAKTVTLKNQLSILEDQIYKNNLKIEITQNQLDKTNLEIDKTSRQVADKTNQISANKNRLAEFIRLINKNDQRDFIEILASNDSFSDFFDQLNYLNDIQAQIGQSVIALKQKKKELDEYNLTLNNKKDELDTLQGRLEQQQDKLAESKIAKDDLLTETNLSERKYRKIIVDLQRETKQVNSEIMNLEATVRQKLKSLNQEGNDFNINKEAQLAWPISPKRGITSYFHDPDYPFRNIFEHPAIDIRAYQKTPIKAAESGYVARAKDGGYGYSYIMIIHGNGLSTVYGHVSGIDVAQDSYVVKGQVIGKTGGMPGTRGAGRLSTGPHLHLEVRQDGIPVNPLEYLP